VQSQGHANGASGGRGGGGSIVQHGV
jgi:hypothetical protein